CPARQRVRKSGETDERYGRCGGNRCDLTDPVAGATGCAGQSPATHHPKGGSMYIKPKLERFGSVRELTRLGTNPDCDGGIFGIGDGDELFCKDKDRS